MLIAVGSKNPAKIKAAKIAVVKLFPKAIIQAVNVKSGVNNQPQSDEETIKGAINRARRAINKTKAEFGIGMEGGIHKVGNHWFECGWVAVVDKNGNLGLGSSARWKLPKRVTEQLLKGKELDEIYTPFGYKVNRGVMSLITNGHLPRHAAYSHGILFAFAPFISNPKFWK